MKIMKLILFLLAITTSCIQAAGVSPLQISLSLHELRISNTIRSYLTALEASAHDDTAPYTLQELCVAGCRKVVNDGVQLDDCSTQWDALIADKRVDFGSWTISVLQTTFFADLDLAVATFKLTTSKDEVTNDYVVIKIFRLTPGVEKKITEIIEFVSPLIDDKVPDTADAYSILFEDETIRFSYWSLPADAEIGAHRDVFQAVTVALNGGTVTRFEADGSTTEVTFPTHIGVYRSADEEDVMHRSKNTGGTDLSAITLQFKKTLPVEAPIEAVQGLGVHYE